MDGDEPPPPPKRVSTRATKGVYTTIKYTPSEIPGDWHAVSPMQPPRRGRRPGAVGNRRPAAAASKKPDGGPPSPASPDPTPPPRRRRAFRRPPHPTAADSALCEVRELDLAPRTRQAVLRFAAGERSHDFGKCDCCKELRLVAFATPPIADAPWACGPPPVANKPWRLRDDPDAKAAGEPPAALCDRCFKDRAARRKDGTLGVVPATFSGWRSDERDRAAADGAGSVRDNNMHWLPVPSFLRGLRPMERMLVAKIQCIQHLEMRKGGQLASRPIVTSILGQTRLASAVPMAAVELNHIVLLREGGKPGTVASKVTFVERAPVRRAARGLCFGWPEGGYASRAEAVVLYPRLDALYSADDTSWHARLLRFEGPSHQDYQQHVLAGAPPPDPARGRPVVGATDVGRWFLAECAPNVFWAHTPYSPGNLNAVPVVAGPLKGLVVLESLKQPGADEEPDLGPAPEQRPEADGSEGDVERNVLISALDPRCATDTHPAARACACPTNARLTHTCPVFTRAAITRRSCSTPSRPATPTSPASSTGYSRGATWRWACRRAARASSCGS